MTIQSKLLNLIEAGNDTTGNEDTNITDVIQALIDGYGGTGTRYTVTYSLMHSTSSSTASKVSEGRTYTTTITPDTGYVVNSVSVSMGSTVLPNAYNESTGVITVENVSGNITISVVTEIEPIDLLNVTWANHAITCGQSTNNYNAWSPHNLQYDSTRDEFVFLQCHCNKHLNQTYTNWTLSVINPYDATDVEDITIPTFSGLGMLFVENGTWTLLPRNGSAIYQSSDRGLTWDTISASVPQYIFGVYKCGNKYFAGNDSNNEITYYESSDLINWSTKSFDSTLGYSILCETTFCEFDGKYWAFNRTNDSTLGHPVILVSEDQGGTWELFSDQLLHGYRSTVSCYPFKNYIMIADIDRDGGVAYYSKFDGTEITELNTWVLPCGGDDFHNINLTSNYKDTVVIEFMHGTAGTNTTKVYVGDKMCDNVMLIGSTEEMPSLSFNYIDTTSDIVSYLNTKCATGLNGGSYTWANTNGVGIRGNSGQSTSAFVDEIEVDLNLIHFITSNTSGKLPISVKHGDGFALPMNNSLLNPSVSHTMGSYNGSAFFAYIGYININNIRYAYGFGGHASELPVLTRADYIFGSSAYTPSSGHNAIVGESWQESLPLRKVLSFNESTTATQYVTTGGTALTNDSNYATGHKFGLMSYTPVSD